MKREARKYDKRVAILETEYSSDGFGGTRASGSLGRGNRWAMVENPKQVVASQYRNDFGLKADAQILKFYFRFFDFDIKKNFLVYNGDTFMPLAVEPSDQYRVETVIVAQALFDSI